MSKERPRGSQGKERNPEPGSVRPGHHAQSIFESGHRISPDSKHVKVTPVGEPNIRSNEKVEIKFYRGMVSSPRAREIARLLAMEDARLLAMEDARELIAGRVKSEKELKKGKTKSALDLATELGIDVSDG